MSSNQITVYVIRICEYHNLFEKVIFNLPQPNNLNAQQIIQLLMKSNQSTASSNPIKTEDLRLYRIEKGYNYVYEKKFEDNNQPENDDIFVIRYNMSKSFAGALQTYQSLSNTTSSTQIKFIYQKMVEAGLPYFVAINTDGSCYYYAVIYGLFMNALIENNENGAIKYLTNFSTALHTFNSDENNSRITSNGYSVDDFTNSIKDIDDLKTLFKNIQSQSLDFQIKRLIFDSIISCYPNFMYSLRLALKCQWLNYLQANKNNNNEITLQYKSTNNINFNEIINVDEEIDKILPKTMWVSDFLPQYVQNILEETAPTVIKTLALLGQPTDNINDMFKLVPNQIRKSKANVAFTGGHYDIALTSDYAYNIDVIKDYIDGANKFTIQSDNLTVDEQINQHSIIDKLESERNKLFEEAIKTSKFEKLANEPGINYLTSQSDFFSEGNKDFRTKLRNYIISKGSVELLENLMVSYFEKTPNATNLPQGLYGDLPERPNNNASLNVKQAYLHEANSELYAQHINNSSVNWNDVWNVYEKSFVASATQPTTINVANPVTKPTTINVANPVTKPTTINVANPVIKPTTINAANPATQPAITNEASQSFNAWAELNEDGTVKQVVFNEPSGNVMTLDKWKNNPTANTYVNLTFQLDEQGLSTRLDFNNNTITNGNLDIALSDIIKKTKEHQ